MVGFDSADEVSRVRTRERDDGGWSEVSAMVTV